MQLSTFLSNAIVTNLKTVLESEAAVIYVFSGAVPASANAALDMVGTHTQLVALSGGGTGDPLEFSTPNGIALLKDPAQDWEGVANFEGFQAATPTLTPTFARLVIGADTGRTLATTGDMRIQFTVGGPGTGAEYVLDGPTITEGNTVPMANAELYQPNGF